MECPRSLVPVAIQALQPSNLPDLGLEDGPDGTSLMEWLAKSQFPRICQSFADEPRVVLRRSTLQLINTVTLEDKEGGSNACGD
eukprot:6463428-Amphidinium_carterae.1